MSIARVQSFAFAGIDAQPVEIQVQISSGLPTFLMVGLPDKAVGEARERVRAALTAMGLALPPKRVLINLAPADMLKEGSHFDLPVALAVLAAMDVLPREEIAQFAALGELSLDGRVNPVAGVLPAAIAAQSRELGLICPESQGAEAGWAGDLTVLAAPDLLSLINHFRGTQIMSQPPEGMLGGGYKTLDLADVRGMETARRALEIAAAGGHNLLMIGPPGGGKSMLAARLPGLLPDLLPREALEVSMVHSVAGMLEDGRLVTRPPFREPHHSASMAAISGGGCRFYQKAGLNNNKLDSRALAIQDAAALAHCGVLFLDGVDHCDSNEIMALSNIMRLGVTTPSWCNPKCAVAAKNIVVLTIHAHSPDLIPREKPICKLIQLFDLIIEVSPLAANTSQDESGSKAYEPTCVVAARVNAARERRIRREVAGQTPFGLLGCKADLDRAAEMLLVDAEQRFGLGSHAVNSVCRVSRTIADLAGSPSIERQHVAEALWTRPRLQGGRRLPAL